MGYTELNSVNSLVRRGIDHFSEEFASFVLDDSRSKRILIITRLILECCIHAARGRDLRFSTGVGCGGKITPEGESIGAGS